MFISLEESTMRCRKWPVAIKAGGENVEGDFKLNANDGWNAR
jgi:hypothetical protein